MLTRTQFIPPLKNLARVYIDKVAMLRQIKHFEACNEQLMLLKYIIQLQYPLCRHIKFLSKSSNGPY